MVLMACLKVSTDLDGEFLIVAGILFHATIVAVILVNIYPGADLPDVVGGGTTCSTNVSMQ